MKYSVDVASAFPWIVTCGVDYSLDHWVNLVAWGRGVGLVRSGGVVWVNVMNVVDGGVWVDGDG